MPYASRIVERSGCLLLGVLPYKRLRHGYHKYLFLQEVQLTLFNSIFKANEIFIKYRCLSNVVEPRVRASTVAAFDLLQVMINFLFSIPSHNFPLLPIAVFLVDS